jgi:asparagine synthase (glutamine-hydrolysing)
MIATMRHRGPDDSGLYFDDANGLALGFRRLAIIDLSPAGHQPMANEDETIWLVFNGEIYNFLALRPWLEAKGHRFRSRTDSETIIHQYEESGPACVEQFNGMFGFALWDANRPRLLLARDRIGKKPLYYYDDGARLFFASELKAILTDRTAPRQVDQDSLGAYLTLKYVPSPYTIFQNIRKLPPGHILTFEQGQAAVQRYWDWLPAFQTNGAHRSEAEWCEEVAEVLRESVRDRLVSDVPLGAFLSGGIDSSAVVATMAGLSEQPVKTFSIGFVEERYNELHYARQVAERFSTDHHEFIVEPEDLREVLPRLVAQFDEPFADSSAVPTYYVSKIAREQVTVVLSGDGGDEALAGYRHYAQALSEARLDGIPLALRKALMALPLATLPNGVKGYRFARRFQMSADERHIYNMSSLTQEEVRDLLADAPFNSSQRTGTAFLLTWMQNARHLDYLSRMQYVDGMAFLPEDILVKVDRMSMLNSLETRCPLLDYRFLELAARIPPSLRYRDGVGKYILKRTLQGILPETILHRSKMGFGIPMSQWFRGDLAHYIREVLLDERTLQRPFWQRGKVQATVSKQLNSGLIVSDFIWQLLVFELWCRTYLDPSPG